MFYEKIKVTLPGVLAEIPVKELFNLDVLYLAINDFDKGKRHPSRLALRDVCMYKVLQWKA